MERGLEILAGVRDRYGVPVLTDVHELAQVERVAEVVDVLQIPAFLCRQTDLVLGAARTGKIVNVKKGQFMAPWDMRGVLDKAASTGNRRIMVTERGFSFGYNNLVVDMRSFPTLRSLGYPVIFDVTHSVQRPGGLGDRSGGEAHFIDTLGPAGAAAGVDGVPPPPVGLDPSFWRGFCSPPSPASPTFGPPSTRPPAPPSSASSSSPTTSTTTFPSSSKPRTAPSGFGTSWSRTPILPPS